MKDMLILESVRERDIDLLMIEEFCVNMDFTGFFLSKLFKKNIIVSNSIAYHSIMDSTFGESDVVLSYAINSKQYFLLIENKIDAVAQEEQALRYTKRAEKLSKKYNCVVDTCIVAPQNYLDNNSEASKYEMHLSYETLQNYFKQKNTLRDIYKSNIIRLAIEQDRRGYIAIKDENVTNFWHKYWELLKQQIPNAFMNEPLSIPSNSDWAVIKFKYLPDKCFIYHKFEKGYIDLQTPFTEDEANQICQKYNNNRMKVVKTGKSFSIRIEVASINKRMEIEKQINAVYQAFDAIKMFDIG